MSTKNKMLKKIAVIVAALVLGMSTFGCGGREQEKEVNDSMTQLYVFIYDGGVAASGWLDAAIERFEATYANYSFEEGKVGVQVFPTEAKDASWRSDALLSRMPTLREEVFFTEEINYYQYVAKEGILHNITDLIEDPLNIAGDQRSIEAKMSDSQKNFYSVNGEYYALPYFEASLGMFYDKDLFYEKDLYFARNPVGDNPFVTKTNSEKSLGQDGLPGTEDDGLPVTYEEFYTLLRTMKYDKGITAPLSWPGNAQEYLVYLAAAMAYDQMGAEDAFRNVTFTGSTELLDGTYSEGYTSTTREITPRTGYELAKQPAWLDAVEFYRDIVINQDYYDPISLSSLYTHVDNQSDFLYSGYDDRKTGILVDGTYWESEATTIFNNMSDKPASSKAERNFGFMPYPRKTATSEPHVLTALFNATAFINGNIQPNKVEVAETFLKFCYTDASLSAFTQITSIPWALKYEIDPNDWTKMSSYGKSLWEIRKESEIVYPYAPSAVFKYAGANATQPGSMFMHADESGNEISGSVMSQFTEKHWSAEQYFDAMFYARREQWKEYERAGIFD